MDRQIASNLSELKEISKEFPPAMTPLKRAAQLQGMRNNKELN